MSIAALIFDVDGTLAETEEAHRAAFNRAFAARGLGWHWDRDTYGRLLAVTGGKERIAAHQATLAGPPVLDAAAIRDLHAAKTAIFAELVAAGLPPKPGVTDLVRAARGQGRRVAIATTTTRANVDALVHAIWGQPAGQVFDVIAAGDEVPAKKPAPDVYLLALERLGVRAAQAIAFEDSRNGVLSAMAAGLRVIAAPSEYTSAAELAGADLVTPALDRAEVRAILA